jgi:glycosyltransferase involved in cell wall biosynthesis
MTDKTVKISVAVPLYNEEESAPVLYDKITSVLEELDSPYEILFVDDGSSDKTFDVIADIAARDERLRVIKFRRNFGQTPAMAAGIDHANGEIIITMDGDLQNDPKDIPNFVREIEAGFDIVVGWRKNRKDKLVTRKIPSKIANWLIGKVTGVPIKDNGCSLKAYRAEVIKNVSLYSEMHRFIPAMANVSGARIKEIEVRHHARQFGESKYGLSRIYKVLIDLAGIATIRAASSAPVRWFAILALPFLLIGSSFVIASLGTQASTNGFSTVFAGTGLSFLALAMSLVFGGALVELVVLTGSLRTRDMVRNTLRIK